MTKNVLLCYGTRYGATAEIAERIAQTLRDRDARVDLFNLKTKNPNRLSNMT